MKVDACADTLMDKDCHKCWNHIYKISNNKAVNHVSNIGDVSGSENITQMWKKHFENLYSTKVDTNYQQIFTSKLLNYSVDTNDLLFTVYAVTDAGGKQKLHKAAGIDGIQMEAFIYGCHRLHVYLSVLFNIFAKYGYITSEFCRAGIIPLVKNKNGNLTDMNNYRALAMSNAISNLLEEIILKHLDSVDEAVGL